MSALRAVTQSGYPLATLEDSGVMPCVPRRPSAPDTLVSTHRLAHGANDAGPDAVAKGAQPERSRTVAIRALPLRGQLSLPFATAWADSSEQRARRAALFDTLLSEKAKATGGARENAWTSRAVARRLSVTESAIRWWRTGGRPVTDDVVEQLGLGAEWRAAGGGEVGW